MSAPLWNHAGRAYRAAGALSVALYFHNTIMGFSVVNGQVFHNSSGAASSSDKSLVLVNRVYGIGNVSSWFRGERELLDNNDIRRGELVVLRHPADPNVKIMRQVVGVNRELVVVSDDNLVVVPSGRCWLANEAGVEDQQDSRELGTLSIGLVDGTAVAVLWPPARWRVF